MTFEQIIILVSLGLGIISIIIIFLFILYFIYYRQQIIKVLEIFATSLDNHRRQIDQATILLSSSLFSSKSPKPPKKPNPFRIIKDDPEN